MSSKKNSVPYGEGRVSKSCLGCKFFMGATQLCGRPSKIAEESGYERIDHPESHTCNNYAFDKSKAPKL